LGAVRLRSVKFQSRTRNTIGPEALQKASKTRIQLERAPENENESEKEEIGDCI
jgi:hypothetical protein